MKALLISALAALCLNGDQGSETLLIQEGIENAYPRLSKDGTQMLFQSNRTGKWQLFIRDLESGTETQVGPPGHECTFPDWSADNDWIAFVCDRNGNEDIFVMHQDGSDLKQLTEHEGRDIHPYFSPDGQALLFNSDRGNGSFDIFRLHLQSGEVRQLTNTPENETCARYSPDMKRIVYLKNSARLDDVFEMTDEGADRNVTNTPFDRDGWPMYSPDGGFIYYSAMENGRFAICRVPQAGGPSEKLTQPAKGEEHARVYVANDNASFIYNVRRGQTISIVRQQLPDLGR